MILRQRTHLYNKAWDCRARQREGSSDSAKIVCLGVASFSRQLSASGSLRCVFTAMSLAHESLAARLFHHWLRIYCGDALADYQYAYSKWWTCQSLSSLTALSPRHASHETCRRSAIYYERPNQGSVFVIIISKTKDIHVSELWYLLTGVWCYFYFIIFSVTMCKHTMRRLRDACGLLIGRYGHIQLYTRRGVSGFGRSVHIFALT